ncbi:unnamed protein product [Cuscuta epithymum]|uniref:RING-type E3 ubiquitin transferase n=1 Tax=Cuscuta epithymum TaxID=186058 RepID=A0AAV0FGX8_9ASTE|nr:unnamed protein product [Cuscuta epithymum]
MEEHLYSTTFTLEHDAASTVTCGDEDSMSHRHVHFTYEIVGLESFEDSHTMCVFSDLVHAPEEHRHDFFREELSSTYLWPIEDEAIINSIADAVIARVAQPGPSFRVDIRTTAYDEDDAGALPDHAAEAEAVYLAPEVIQLSLKRKRVDECGGGEVACAICLDGVPSGAEVPVMPCNHSSFHMDCLLTWLRRNLSCPLCRRKISVCDS